jgi:hypothetical protein
MVNFPPPEMAMGFGDKHSQPCLAQTPQAEAYAT